MPPRVRAVRLLWLKRTIDAISSIPVGLVGIGGLVTPVGASTSALESTGNPNEGIGSACDGWISSGSTKETKFNSFNSGKDERTETASM
jgi:hypothetical protein